MAEQTLADALCAAQAEFPPVVKGAVNPHFKSRYTDLGEGMAVIRPILGKHGIAYTQTFHVAEGTLLLRTSLRRGGEEIASDLPIAQPPKPQDFVALTTYYRRVGLFSALGITPVGEDDDGQTANDVATTQAPPRQTRQPPQRPRPVESPEQAVERANREAEQRDPWKLGAASADQRADLMLIAIDSKPWPEVEAAMAGYRELVKRELSDADRKMVTDAYVARRDAVRQDMLPMAG